jgi:translocation and assembly module TamB
MSTQRAGHALAATASREGDRVRIPRLRAAAGGGELYGEGTISLAGAKPFEARAKFSRLDPAAFGDYPSATLNGDFTASGALEPAWRADVRFTVAGSRFRGTPLAGSGTFNASPQGVRDADATAMLGANRLTAKGSYGRPGDALALDVDARNLASSTRALPGGSRARRRSAARRRDLRSPSTCAARNCAGQSSRRSTRSSRRASSLRGSRGRSISQ